MADPRRLYHTPTARRELDGYARFIAKDSPERAKRWLSLVEETLSRLMLFPESGSPVKTRRLSRLGLRFVPVGDVLIFYTVTAARVEIRRVLHGRRRYEPLL